MAAPETYVEAALGGANGSEAYFFLADHWVAFNWANDRVVDGVRPVTEWGLPPAIAPPGPGPGLDSALRGKGPYAGKAYFFRGAAYARYDWASTTMETPVPPSLGAWSLPGAFAGGVSASYNGRFSREPYCYFCRGSEYVRYIWAEDRVDNGYPKPIGTLMGMPAEFAAGLDAAVDGDGPYQQYGYFFKQDRYLRFDWAPGGGEPHVDGAPTPIHPAWPGLAELLLAGKAKAQCLVWLHAARAQLFAYIAFLGGAPFPFNQGVMEAALATHFHLAAAAAPADKIAVLTQIVSGYNSSEAVLGQSGTLFRYRTDAEAAADGDPDVNAAYVFAGKVNFTRNFIPRGPMNRAASVLHESVHVWDPQSGLPTTHIPEWYVTDAAAAALGLSPAAPIPELATRYDLMTTADALHNPSAYAAFAQHVALGSDTRYGEGHHDL